MKIIVFGGSGFLGSHVCDKLTDAGHKVLIFDLKQSPWLHSDQEMIIGDISDKNAVQSAVLNADIVFNFAGISDLDIAMTHPVETVETNILGNVLILEACKEAGIKRYIFASTVYVYSRTGGFYRCSKQACESYIENYQRQYDLEYTTLRFGSLYGPRSDKANAIYKFIDQALKDKRISYGGDSESIREYIHVEDAATACLEILKPEYANESVTLTGHQSMRVYDLMHMIKEILGNDVELEFSNDMHIGHYEITPYSYIPKLAKKYAAPLHIDLGQGLVQLIEHQYKEISDEKDKT
jgi:UDP-glucose 4-epimerase